jgi:hypothetical protein
MSLGAFEAEVLWWYYQAVIQYTYEQGNNKHQ